MCVMSPEFEPIFAKLRGILEKYAGHLTVKEDAERCYCLEGGRHPTHKRPMPIAWVQIGKAYVSYHLMPVYACPNVLDGHSAKLKSRMQGKSCFNFKTEDDALFAELEQLTEEGFEAFRKAGYLPDKRLAEKPAADRSEFSDL